MGDARGAFIHPTRPSWVVAQDEKVRVATEIVIGFPWAVTQKHCSDGTTDTDGQGSHQSAERCDEVWHVTSAPAQSRCKGL
jgi:hypothetical protein